MNSGQADQSTGKWLMNPALRRWTTGQGFGIGLELRGVGRQVGARLGALVIDDRERGGPLLDEQVDGTAPGTTRRARSRDRDLGAQGRARIATAQRVAQT